MSEQKRNKRMNLRWFNAGSPDFLIGRRRTYIRLWNLFNRHTSDGDHWWGVGVFQVNKRHLFCISHGGVSILFIGETR